jgi:SAM-dependent methyltransferase
MTSKTERTAAQLRHHYEVESALAARLKATHTPAERAAIYATMYRELFQEVPDHPRLTMRRNPAAERLQVARLLQLLAPHLRHETEYVEFGAGTGALALAVAARVQRVRVVEIADQIPAGTARPANFELVLYDGWNLALPHDSAGVVFSEQFVEHLHPDDARHHLQIVQRLLHPGGCYILRTPERWTGPHDISRDFADEPQGFHLREWTYGELAREARAVGFERVRCYWNARGVRAPVPLGVFKALESLMAAWPRRMRHTLGHRLIPMVTMELWK